MRVVLQSDITVEQVLLAAGDQVEHGNISILFSSNVDVNIVSSTEIVKGRVLKVKAEIVNFTFSFINVYAPNQDSEYVEFFKILNEK